MRTPFAYVVAVGDELIGGRRADANGPYLAHVLESLGASVKARVLVGDNEDAIASFVGALLAERPDVVLVAGGLGPTDDDRTREGVARALGVPLDLDESFRESVEERYRERGREAPAEAQRQALRPRGSELLKNPVGTAPGFLIERGPTLVAGLPGVPRQLKAMFERGVLPGLRRRLAGGHVGRESALRVVGLAESQVNKIVFEELSESDTLRLGLMATAGEVEIRLNARGEDEEDAESLLERARGGLETRLGDHVYGRDGDTLVSVLEGLLVERNMTLGAAESCTGGLVARTITDMPGASRIFRGAIVAYDNREKATLLGVDAELLERYGSVSAEVARAMALGGRGRLGVDVCLSTTGIAGPSGGSADKPVGLVYLGIATPDRVIATRHLLSGDREGIRRWSTKLALEEARRVLLGLSPVGELVEDEDAIS